MIIFKVFGYVFVFSSCALGGYVFKNKIKTRVKELENMISCITVLENEIRVSMSDIISASNKVLSVAKGENIKLFNNIIEAQKNNDGHTLSELWTESVYFIADGSCYTKEDINVFVRFGDVLGSGDSQSQVDNLKKFKLQLSEMSAEAKETVKQKGILFEKVGIYIGAIIVILLM